MWGFYEAYDPRTQILYLDLRDSALPEPVLTGLPVQPRLLESFDSAADADVFVQGYLKALHYDAKRVVKEVHCGGLRPADCKGPGGPCVMGLEGYWCSHRCGPRSSCSI